jgi:ATP-dependent helicase HrpB
LFFSDPPPWYDGITVNPVSLPIDVVLPEVVAALQRSSAVVVRAPTGAGKTTRVPPALLDAGLAGTGQILLLEPRRLAARAAARRMAAERGGRVGGEIGYHVRFDRQAGPATRLLVVTPGMLLRRLLDEPFLESVGILIFDEFHERGLDSDLALGIARLLQQTVRPDLRIVAMSATLAVERVAAYLGDCPIVASEGRLFPVEIEYQPRSLQVPWPEAAADATASLLERTDGDILVFLPGMQEIRRTAAALTAHSQADGVLVLPLHGDLPAEEQDRALLPQARRRVVLATNVAETSVTVEGISGVVDTGLARIMNFDPDLGLDRLELVPIARDSAEQRSGRAGRQRPGVCVRLWSEASHRQRPEQTEPEVRRVDLAGALLHLLCMGETDWQHFPWLETPREEAIVLALALLARLGAIDGHSVTRLGRRLALLPVHPRLGRLLVEGKRLGCTERAALAAALLSEREPIDRRTATAHVHDTSSDVLDRVEAMEEFERSGRTVTPAGELYVGSARSTLRVRDQLLRGIRSIAEGNSDREASVLPADEALLRALLTAFPDRVARRRDADRSRGLIVGGKGVRLAPSCGVRDAPLFVCIDVDSRSAEAWVRQASAIQRDWLSASAITAGIEVAFDAESERVTARRVIRYEDLVLEESVAALPKQEEVGRVLAAAAQERLDQVLPAPDSAGGSFLLRVRCLRVWMPELELPSFDDAQLREIVPWLCAGCRSFDELRRADWLGALQDRLTPRQRHAVERDAPERFEVPSGSRVALQYAPGRPPILAVRIQEIFGLAETPRIAAGRVRVLLHLLAPNYRPQQVTDDLASFWANTYVQVRRELRARYPRHAWPEDPLTATPERRPRRK